MQRQRKDVDPSPALTQALRDPWVNFHSCSEIIRELDQMPRRIKMKDLRRLRNAVFSRRNSSEFGI
jgi:hypothetical protein